MIWRPMSYRVATESIVKIICLEKKNRKTICEPYQKAFSLVWIILIPKPVVQKKKNTRNVTACEAREPHTTVGLDRAKKKKQQNKTKKATFFKLYFL